MSITIIDLLHHFGITTCCGVYIVLQPTTVNQQPPTRSSTVQPATSKRANFVELGGLAVWLCDHSSVPGMRRFSLCSLINFPSIPQSNNITFFLFRTFNFYLTTVGITKKPIIKCKLFKNKYYSLYKEMNNTK